MPPLAKALFATLLFSSAPASIRVVALGAIALGIARLAIASGGMTLWLIATGRWKKNKQRLAEQRTWFALVCVGLAFGGHWLTFFTSIKLASASIGAIGFATYGIHLVVMGWLLGRGTVSVVDLASLALAVVGTLLLVPEFSFENQHTLGLAVGVVSGFLAALLPLLHQKFADIDVGLRAWGQFTFALLVFLPFWPMTQWQIETQDLLVVLYLGVIVGLFAHGIWVQSMTELSTTTISIVSYLYLPTSLLVAFLTLGERLTVTMLVGTVCVFVANGIALYTQARKGTLAAVAD